jgi:hypothetical protein
LEGKYNLIALMNLINFNEINQNKSGNGTDIVTNILVMHNNKDGSN